MFFIVVRHTYELDVCMCLCVYLIVGHTLSIQLWQIIRLLLNAALDYIYIYVYVYIYLCLYIIKKLKWVIVLLCYLITFGLGSSQDRLVLVLCTLTLEFSVTCKFFVILVLVS